MSQSGDSLIKQALLNHGLDAVLAEVHRLWDELQQQQQQQQQQPIRPTVDVER
jgi:hypothetical protein